MRRHSTAASTVPRLWASLRVVASPLAPRQTAAFAPRLPPTSTRLHPVLTWSSADPSPSQRAPEGSMSQQQPRRQQNGYGGPPQGGPPQRQGAPSNAAFHAAADAAARTSSTTKAHLTAVRFDSLSISAPTQRCGRLSPHITIYTHSSIVAPPLTTQCAAILSSAKKSSLDRCAWLLPSLNCT